MQTIAIRVALAVTPLLAALLVAQQQPEAPKINLGSDANGNPLRLAVKTGHVSNYDEAKVRPYSLPDPRVRADGTRVRNRSEWPARRREILGLYETHIYGRVPPNVPPVTWKTLDTEVEFPPGEKPPVSDKVTRRAVGFIGTAIDGPQIHLTIYTPADVTRRERNGAGYGAPASGASGGDRGKRRALLDSRARQYSPGQEGVPLILLVNFGGGRARATGGRNPAAPAAGEPPVATDILARGWGYATMRYQDIQPDRADAWSEGVIGATLAPGQQRPAADEWGTISAWAWGISRVIDYLETNRAIDPKRIAVFGHSRLGKTVLWASARDERIAAVFSSCSGEMGASLARRDWGETVDDMAQNFAWQFAGNFQQWVGRWNDMPVDAHMLIALSAPRPVFVTGGTRDQWADPVGQFLALVAAGPVYRLLGRRDAGTTELPPIDTPLTSGDLGWHYHTGGHMATAADWQAFLKFLAKYFEDRRR